MASILDQNLLLWSTQHETLLNNCSVDNWGSPFNSSESSTSMSGINGSAQDSKLPCNLSTNTMRTLMASLEANNLTHHLNSSLNYTQPTYVYESNRFFIPRPHDMLHPSEINPTILPMVLTHILTFLVGVIGNAVVILTWSMHGKFRSPTTVFLVSLAIADLILLLVLVPLETMEYFMITWYGISLVCKSIAYVEVMTAMSTVLNLVAVSIERYLVIVYPMRARSWCTMSSTRKGLVIIWGLALALSTPVLLTKTTSELTYYNETTSLTLYYCFDVETDLTFIVAIYQLLVMFIFPALFMVLCYYVVIRQLWVSTRSVNAMTRADNQNSYALHQSHSISSMASSVRTLGGTGSSLAGNSLLRKEVAPTHLQEPGHSKQQNGNAHKGYRWYQRRWWGANGLVPTPTSDLPNGAQQPDPTDPQQLTRVQWQGSESTNASHKQKGCRCHPSYVLCCCFGLGCDSGPVRNEEISECTMSSSYQMTSYVDNPRAGTGSIIESPVEEREQEPVFFVSAHLSDSSASRVHDNHHHQPPTHTQHQQNHSRTLASNVMEITKSRFQVIKMLVLIVALFLLCWGPRLIMNVLVKMGLSSYSPWIYNARVVCNLLSFVHSALNPFVYGFMSSNFRAMVCSSCGRHNRNKEQQAQHQQQSSRPQGRQAARKPQPRQQQLYNFGRNNQEMNVGNARNASAANRYTAAATLTEELSCNTSRY